LGAIMESEVSSSLTAALGSASPGLIDVVSTGNVAAAAAGAPAGLADQVSQASSVAFVDGLNTILLISAILAFSGAVLAALLVRERDTREPAGDSAAEEAPVMVAG
ncbi:MAG TPA: hypothetical protein VHF58_05905, partial [Solirubrobacterales bacterium]|nr:hypothetical protein [Solirubrobacterales bacterium]